MSSQNPLSRSRRRMAGALLAAALGPLRAGPAAPPPLPAAAVPVPLPGLRKPVATFLLIKDKLAAQVYAHTLETDAGPLPCWTYVTTGLAAVHQKEMLLTVRRGPGEAEDAFDRFIPNLFTSFYRFAEQGRTVDVGGYTQLGPGGTPLLGRKEFLGLIYTAQQSLAGVEVGPGHLHALLVTDRELKLALAYGVTRLQARLGFASRYYPVPPWIDRQRPEVAGADPDEARSLLAKMPRLPVAGLRVRGERTAAKGALPIPAPSGSDRTARMEVDRVVVTVAPGAAARLKAYVEDAGHAEGACFLTELDPEADACLVWNPGDTRLRAITLPGGMAGAVTGNHLLLLGNQPASEMRFVEDGYALFLTAKDWAVVRAALAEGRPASLPAAGAMPAVEIRWADPGHAAKEPPAL